MIRFLFCLALLVPSSLLADMKIGYVDSERLLSGLPAFQAVLQEMEELKAQYNQQVAERHGQLISLEQTIRKQALLLSDARRAELETEYQHKAQSLRALSDSLFGPQGRLEMRYQELATPLYEGVNEAIHAYARQHGFDLVLDAAANRGVVVFAKPEYDLTDALSEVLAEN